MSQNLAEGIAIQGGLPKGSLVSVSDNIDVCPCTADVISRMSKGFQVPFDRRMELVTNNLGKIVVGACEGVIHSTSSHFILWGFLRIGGPFSDGFQVKPKGNHFP